MELISTVSENSSKSISSLKSRSENDNSSGGVVSGINSDGVSAMNGNTGLLTVSITRSSLKDRTQSTEDEHNGSCFNLFKSNRLIEIFSTLELSVKLVPTDKVYSVSRSSS